MKNFLVVDGATNCAYDVFSVSDDVFKLIFPGEGQDIEFGEDLDERIDSNMITMEELGDIYKTPVVKKNIQGIHGILFIGLSDQKKIYYPNKMDSDLEWTRT